jgi:hypothetical protein
VTLLEDIQQAAVDGTTDLGTILRKCKVLAARIGSKELEDWLVWESNGYPDGAPVPSYRIWPLVLKGHFVGSFGAQIRKAEIPLACVPEHARDSYMNYACRQSVASIETILKDPATDTIAIHTGDLSVVLGGNVYRGYTCLQSWAEFHKSCFLEVLNSVRNRILDFALAIWKDSPNAGSGDPGSAKTLDQGHITQVFNTTIYGGTAQVIAASHGSHVEVTVKTNDLESLDKYLQSIGVTSPDIEELHNALKADPRPESPAKYGPRLSAWFGKMMTMSKNGALGVGVEAAGNLLGQALGKYFGIIP